MAVDAADVDVKPTESRESPAVADGVHNIQVEERDEFAPAPLPKVNVWKQRQETRKQPVAGPEILLEASAKVTEDSKEVETLPNEGLSKTPSTGGMMSPTARPIPVPKVKQQEIDTAAWPTPEKSAGAKALGEKENEGKKNILQSSSGSSVSGKTKKWISITPTILHTPLPSKTNFRARPSRGRGNGAAPEDVRGRMGKIDFGGRPTRAGSLGSNVRHDKQGKIVSPILPGERSSTFHDQVGGSEKLQIPNTSTPQTPNGQAQSHRHENQFHRRGSSVTNKQSTVSQISPSLSNIPAADRQISNLGVNGMPRTNQTAPTFQSRYPQMYDYQLQLAMGYPIYDMSYQHIMVLQNQMEYYFSDSNLLSDMFLRQNMDSQGFVKLALILAWPRMKALNADLHTLRLACFNSPLLHYIGEEGIDRVRKSEAWRKWVLEIEQREPDARVEGPSYSISTGINEDDQAQRLSSVAPPFVPTISTRGIGFNGEYAEFEVDIFPNEAAKYVAIFTGTPVATLKKKEQANGTDPKEEKKVNGGSVSPRSTVTDESHALSCHSRQEVGWAVHHEYTSSHPVHGECNEEAYLLLHNRATKDRQSADMHILYRFWAHFLQENWNRTMYDEFRSMAIEDANNEDRFGIERLFNFYLHSLKRTFRQTVFADFCTLSSIDAKNGYLIGLQKMSSFIQHVPEILLPPDLAQWMSLYNANEDFGSTKGNGTIADRYTTEQQDDGARVNEWRNGVVASN